MINFNDYVKNQILKITLDDLLSLTSEDPTDFINQLIEFMSHNKEITGLALNDIFNIGFTQQELKPLRKVFWEQFLKAIEEGKLSHIEKLDLSKNSTMIAFNAEQLLASISTHIQDLQSLDLSNNNLCIKDSSALNHLKSLSKLATLGLSSNNFLSKLGARLAELIPEIPTLHSLDISDNYINLDPLLNNLKEKANSIQYIEAGGLRAPTTSFKDTQKYFDDTGILLNTSTLKGNRFLKDQLKLPTLINKLRDLITNPHKLNEEILTKVLQIYNSTIQDKDYSEDKVNQCIEVLTILHETLSNQSTELCTLDIHKIIDLNYTLFPESAYKAVQLRIKYRIPSDEVLTELFSKAVNKDFNTINDEFKTDMPQGGFPYDLYVPIQRAKYSKNSKNSIDQLERAFEELYNKPNEYPTLYRLFTNLLNDYLIEQLSIEYKVSSEDLIKIISDTLYIDNKEQVSVEKLKGDIAALCSDSQYSELHDKFLEQVTKQQSINHANQVLQTEALDISTNTGTSLNQQLPLIQNIMVSRLQAEENDEYLPLHIELEFLRSRNLREQYLPSDDNDNNKDITGDVHDQHLDNQNYG